MKGMNLVMAGVANSSKVNKQHLWSLKYMVSEMIFVYHEKDINMNKVISGLPLESNINCGSIYLSAET